MNAIIVKVKFDEKSMWLTLSDGRMLGIPLVFFPLLQRANLQQLASFTLSPLGIHWEDLHEHVSLERLLSAEPMTPQKP